jgi:heat shock protein HtpX
VLVGLISIIAEIFLRSLWFSHDGGDRKDGRLQLILIVIGIVFAILAPIVANLVSLAISRKREYGADATAVKLTRYPPGLKNALVKIRDESVPEKDKKHYSKAMAPLFMSDPYKKKASDWLSTHPDINERIKILEGM